MNKKEARRKKHESEKKRRQDILDSRIIGADDEDVEDYEAGETVEAGEEEGEEEEETLLGNLARVEHIPVLPWNDLIPVLPLGRQTLNLPPQEDDSWLIRLFQETSEKDHDLLGFLPLAVGDNMEGMVREMLTSRIGMAAQVREVKKTEIGTILIELWGICRFEILDAAFKNDKYINFNVRWFEDDEEPDEILRPLHTEFIKIVQRLAKMRGESLKFYQDTANFPQYDNSAVQYDSFMFADPGYDWFTFKEQIELLRLTSTSERMRRVIERAKIKLPALDNKWTIERRTKNN